MATEVLRGTLDLRMEKEDNLPTPKKKTVQKKVFKIDGFEKYRIPSIHPKSIHLPKYSRVNF